MSLNKLFNFKYFMQNIKKSKMALVIFFIIVPIFTSLMIMTTQDQVLEFAELSIINILGLYVIPFIFSVCLFGYVYKKNSVDFICSMPLSRKSIFITNTIGGIVMIVLMQLLTLILTILIGGITGATIFNAMAFDIFAYQTIAYIFVFIIANLAMSVSGNLLTQIVVTLLITFLVPVSTFFVVMYTSNNSIDLYNDFGDIGRGFYRVINYTAPSMFLSGEYSYNSISIIKMIVLSIIYFGLGLYLFKRRKMEIATGSFENNRTHLLVKGLTLAPFIMLLITFIDIESIELAMILLAIIAVYYFVYDLITNKKIKFKDNFVYMVISIFVLLGAYYSILLVYENYEGKLNVNDIRELRITDLTENDFCFKNTESINKVLLETEIYKYVNEDYTWVEAVITKKGGSTYKRSLYVNISELYKFVGEDTIVNRFDNSLKISDKLMLFNDKEKAEFIKKLSEDVNKYNFEDYQKLCNSSLKMIEFYGYKNHQLIDVAFPIEVSEDVFKMATQAYNKYATQKIQNTIRKYNYMTISAYDETISSTLDLIMGEKYTFYIDGDCTNFILNNADKEIKYFKKGIFAVSDSFSFYTEDIREFLKVLVDEDKNFNDYGIFENTISGESTLSFVE